MIFSDDDLNRLKELLIVTIQGWNLDLQMEYQHLTTEKLPAILARLEAAEEKDCNQFHCGHQSCNIWRKAAGK